MREVHGYIIARSLNPAELKPSLALELLDALHHFLAFQDSFLRQQLKDRLRQPR